MLKSEIVRYIINGLIATFIHYSVLNFNIIILHIESAGIANFIAAIFGIIASFVGSRYFVYKNHTNTLSSQILRFVFLYASIAVLHGFVLYVWTDIYSLNYHFGFVVATLMQVSLSYVGNKILVFKNEK